MGEQRRASGSLEVKRKRPHFAPMSELTVGELAKRSGVRTSALRFYEEQGLRDPSGRAQVTADILAPRSARLRSSSSPSGSA